METHLKEYGSKCNLYSLIVLSVGNDTPESMADPWSTVPELRLNLCVYILCMVGGIVGNITVIAIMLRWVVTYLVGTINVSHSRQKSSSRKYHSDTWKTNLFLLSLSVSMIDYYFDPTVIIKFMMFS